MLIFYVLPLAISTVTGLLLAFYISRRVSAPGALPLIGLMLAAAVWSFGYLLEIISVDLATRIFWAGFQYLGIVSISPAWISFCAEYLGSPEWLAYSRRNQVLLWIMPGVTLGFLLTNSVHRFIWQGVELHTVGDIQMLEFSHGPWFTVFLVYSYVLLIVGSIWLVSRLLSSTHLRQSQIRLALLAVLVPFIGNLVYVSPLNPQPGLDWTPFGFTIAGLLFALSLFRYQLIKIEPIAHKAVFERLEDIILVIDSQDRVVDLNPAAKRKLAKPGWDSIGMPLPKFCPALAGFVEGAEHNQNTQRLEISLGEGPNSCDYDVRITRLADPSTAWMGCLVVLHDVTRRKQEKELLRKAHDELELRVAERTEELNYANQQIRIELAAREVTEQQQQQLIAEIRQSGEQLRAMAIRLQEVQEHERHQIAAELHDRVGQNLTGLNLNLQIILNQLPEANHQGLRPRLDDSLRLVEETTRLVRDVMADLVPPLLDEYGLVSALRWYADLYSRRTGINNQVSGLDFEPRLDRKVEIVFFRIVQEALNNIARHAQATFVEIKIHSDPDRVCLMVEDNGTGFTPDQPPRPSHLGLITMKERAASVGGQVAIQSAPGQGTIVSIEFRRNCNDD